MESLFYNTPLFSTKILIDSGLLDSLDQLLAPYKEDITSLVLLSDKKVAGLYGGKVLKALGSLNKKLLPILIEPGEQNKTREIKQYIEDRLLENEVDRKGVLINLGGGVITDLGGFVAGTYMRGIRYINIPTTLLCMVDASYGGKCGVNTRYGKNLIGIFYHPTTVFMDTSTLNTLPEGELKNGIVEMLKHGLILDRSYWDLLKNNLDSILLLQDKPFLNTAIKRSIEIKIAVISIDEKEKEYRKILNFGHTIAHAIEKISNYTIPHGKAVSFGILYESMISYKLGLLSKPELKEITSLFYNLYPIEEILKKYEIETLIEALYWDKKVIEQKVHIPLLNSIGNIYSKDGKYAFPIELNLLKNIWVELLLFLS